MNSRTLSLLKFNQFCFFLFALSINTYAFQWYTHEDSKLGFTLQLPEAPNYNDEYESFTIYSYSKPNAKTVFSFFALDFRQLNNKKENQTIIDDFITNTINNINGKLIDKEKIPYKGGLKYQIQIKVNEVNMMRSQITLKNDIMCYLSVEDVEAKMTSKDIDTFFNSLRINAPEPLEAKSPIVYKNDKGAFSLPIPIEPQDISREVPNPIDENGEPYKLNMYLSSDFNNNDNYLFRYNDLPAGYYMEDPETSFIEMENSLTGKASLVAEPKTIYLDGYEGKEYELLIDDQYHTICRVYFRGNRTYLLLKQKLVASEKVTRDHPFFTEFKFEPYLPSETIRFSPEGESFETLFFEDRTSTIDTVDYNDSYLKGSADYFAKNPNTGGVYQFGYSELKPYFKITDMQTFYDTNIDVIKNWNDTILSKKEIKIANTDAVELLLQNNETKITTRHQMWLNDKHLFFMSLYAGKEELNSALSDSIFKSFKPAKTETTFDYYASKTDAILAHLKSNDTIVYNDALGAFNYYEFEPKADVSKLHNELKINYTNVIRNNAVKVKIIDELANVNDSTTLEVLQKLYINPSSSETIKASIITTIPHLKNENRLNIYKTLLLNSPPEENDNNYGWSILTPFRDSLDFTNANYKDFIKLIDHQHYREDVLDISISLIKEKNDDASFVAEYFDTLFKHAASDLRAYQDVQQNESEDTNYTYNNLIYSYLDLLNTVQYKNEQTDAFTSAMINEEKNRWLQVKAITARIINNQPLERTFLEDQMDSLSSRMDILRGYHKINQFNRVPKKYIKPESFAKLSLHDFIGEDYSYPDHIETLGKVTKDGKAYYAFSCTYISEDESEEDTSYLAIVQIGKPITQDNDFSRYISYSNWESPEKNWKQQALDLIPDLIEYGY
ncbi:hypothetical protein [uncultured Psychroserpens sp.]|uniref:hypothetical protein n=1 Tax=uncultured Psychroserpens sp. TaxID=255436 RepID=UPI002632C10C|nr:hypothetical protein [uncultured Psychroserpens sp.]